MFNKALRSYYSQMEEERVLVVSRKVLRFFQKARFPTKKELVRMKQLTADISQLFPPDMHDVGAKDIYKRFREQEEANET